MGLRDYRRKRRFGRTPEPSGKTAPRARRRPVFVVQLHQASHRHYDFRLEVGGVLKSWAVPKGPSLRHGEKRLAVQVEDHPLDYAGFEGDIPPGNYGAGHVDIFDRGTWRCEGDPRRALADGKLVFTLHGRKLRGEWALVRTAMRGRQPQWLLLKHDDAYAADREADDLVDAPDPPRGRTPARPARRAAPAAARKATPRRRGMAKGDAAWRTRALAVAGARAGAMPFGFEPELTLLRAAPPTGDDWLHEIKWDGYRLLVDLDGGRARLRSRGGQDWNATFPEVVRAVEALPVREACLDGELVALDARGHSDFSALQRAIEGADTAALRCMLFDLPGLAGVDLRDAPLAERKALLAALLAATGDGGPLGYSDHVVGHGARMFAETRRQGLEGVVSKRVDSPYRSGRTGDWVKAKHEQADEFAVVGYTPPKGSRSGFGSLLLATRAGGGWRYVGRVGTGFDQAALAAIHRRLQPLARKTPTVALPAHVPFPVRTVRWVSPQLVAEVTFRGWAKEGLLRQASFKRLRDDKPVAQLDPPQTVEPAMQITHPDRRMFADSDCTKADVADYYRAVARWLLPELVDRPLSLLRCPDGADDACFFQKHHAEGLGAAVHAIPLKQKSGTEDYLYVDSLDGVLALVQMNTVEFHPWGARIDDPEAPDRLVFDLDPAPGVAWPQVVAAARDVRARLREAGLESFVRLSGGKGLHVVVPIARDYSWDQARLFCESFARTMAEQAPDAYIATMSKARRKGLVFIDWLRNARGATSVASWSLRARAGAPVAMPLRWDELGRVGSAHDFDLPRAKQRAARLRKDPWEGIDGLRQRLPL
jgi:bifunctional non-homologous end joining protein LigD